MPETLRTAAPKVSPSFRPVVELAARWYVFVFLNVYGLAKIAGRQFYRPGELPEEVANTLLGQVDSFDLAWTFMGHSFAYMLFIGIAEMAGAWLLLSQRTKLLGVAVLFPVMVNVLVFDVIFLDKYGALASAAIYTLLLCVIVFCNREQVAQAIEKLMTPAESTQIPAGHKLKVAVLALLAMGLVFAFDQMLVNLLGHGRG